MKLNELSPSRSSRKSAFRVGRGHGSGNGKTAGRGHKGQKARSGGGVRPGFEGGQMPLYRRVPKRGFTNIFAKTYSIVNVSNLNGFPDGTVVTGELLKEARIIRNVKDGIVVLGNGELKAKNLTVKASRFSESALSKIAANGGKTEVV